jgi:hypothetical protein
LLELLLLAIAGAFYPTLLAVVIIFLGRPHPKRLLAFFLAGALIASISIGIAAVDLLDAADIGSSSRNTFSAAVYIPLGVLSMLVGAHFLRTPPKPKQPKKDKGPSMTQRVLTKDKAWLVFVLGIVLNMPGVWYIIALKDIALDDYGEAAEIALIIAFNLIMFAFIEIPLLGYLFAPEWSRKQVDRFNSWLHRHGRHLGGWIGVVIGLYLIARGIFVAL